MNVQAKNRVSKRKPLETPTHVDALIETSRLLILFEMKFTSDISDQTTFNANRKKSVVVARVITILFFLPFVLSFCFDAYTRFRYALYSFLSFFLMPYVC